MTKAEIRKKKLQQINKTSWKLPESFQVPFDAEGNVPFLPQKAYAITTQGLYRPNYQLYKWKDNYIFEDTLQYEKAEKSNSSVVFYFRSTTTNNLYPMLLLDFLGLVKNFDLHKGMVKSKWTFIKVASYYGIIPWGSKRPRAKYKNTGKPREFYGNQYTKLNSISEASRTTV